ncbi:MAG: PEP-CTERM sorting domain-containing protein [Planctomycetes bacterium]|nr:PEP-CTERM sorting domain-containing protein [Planctomycetota bacterium]
MRTKRGPVVVLLAFSFALAAVDGAHAAWTTETVDSIGNVGLFSSLALDFHTGSPRISYYDQTNKALKYASYNGTSWTTPQTVATGQVGTHTSLALYSGGSPGISYYDYPNHALMYSTYNGSTWVTQTVDSSANVGEDTSLVIDALGHPHIAYYDRTNGRLKYVTYNGTSWNTPMVVDTIGTYELGTSRTNISLKLDLNGVPSIAYHSEVSGALQYAQWNGSTSKWDIQVVDNCAHVGAHASLVMVGTKPFIAYREATNWTLEFAELEPPNYWTVQLVDDTGDVGYDASLAIDSHGSPHIAYFAGDPMGDLRLASLDGSIWSGSIWSIETVDSSGVVGLFTSIALDPMTGEPRISYYDSTNGDLKFAYQGVLPVPEPATLAFLAAGAALAMAARRRALPHA